MKPPEWTTNIVEYPNGGQQTFTTIRFDNNLRGAYYHVDGGFVVDRYQRNTKVYTDENDIRRVILTKIRAKIRQWDGMIANLWDETTLRGTGR